MRSGCIIWLVLGVLTACAPPPPVRSAAVYVDPMEHLQREQLEWVGDVVEGGTYLVGGHGYVQNRRGRIVAMAMIFKGTPGQVHPWRLQEGTCGGRGGAIVGPDSVYRPATVQGDGSALASAEIPRLNLVPGSRVKMVVYRSPEEMNIVVGCADLRSRPLGSGNPR